MIEKDFSLGGSPLGGGDRFEDEIDLGRESFGLLAFARSQPSEERFVGI